MKFVQGESIEAIAIGTGPSFYEWIKTPIIQYELPAFTSDDPSPQEAPQLYEPRLFGCGVVPNYINGLDTYCYGDLTHLRNIPDPDGEFHPGVKIYSGGRNINDLKDADRTQFKTTIPMLDFGELDIPHGNSSGGMAVSCACLRYNVVGLVGFDGHFAKEFSSKEGYDDFVWRFRFIINYWQNRGRRLISLMTDSIFNPILEPAVGKIPPDIID